jgi:predicted DNA-binding protein (UPF0251 family)
LQEESTEVARPLKPRWIGFDPPGVCFVPQPAVAPGIEFVVLTLDELEALRLADLEGLGQAEAAGKMNVSRPTFGRIVEQARKKVAAALVQERGIGIEGGVIRFHKPYGHAWGRRGHRGGPHGHGQGRRNGW